MSSRLIIHATNVHQGVDRTWLDAQLGQAPGGRITGLLDSCMAQAEGGVRGIDIVRVKPTRMARPRAERWLAANTGSDDVVLCFGNLPPLFRLRARYGLHATNLGHVPHSEVRTLYADADALIFPPTLESFGLPLIEARQAGLPVLISELDYVRDVLDPEAAFDPYSPYSIARAVKRFCGNQELSLPLRDASEFMNYTVKKGRLSCES